MKPPLKILSLLAVILIALSSCRKPEVYSIIPSISYKNFIILDSTSAYLQINFTDGDGDIGYPTDIAPSPDLYLQYLYDSVAGGKDYFIPLVINGNDTLINHYYVPYLTPAGKDKALNGMIQIKITDWYFSPNKKIEYRIWIFDRASHKSNVITTPPINVPYN